MTARDQNDNTTRSRLTWAGIRGRPTAGTPLASGNITSSGGTTIAGITQNSTGWGALTETVGALHHYAVSAAKPQNATVVFSTTVTAQDQFNNTVTTDNSTVVTMSGTGSVQFDSNGDGTYGDNTKTLSSGTFNINTRDNSTETVNLTATDANGKTGSFTGLAVYAAPANGDYRSAVSGPWATAGTWEKFNGTTWVTATAAPSSSDGVITIRSGYTVTVGATATADQIVVQSGGILTENQVLTLNNGTGTDLDIFGTVNGTAVESVDTAGAQVVVENGGTLDASNAGADLAVNGTLTVAGGKVITTNNKGITGAGTLSILSGTVAVGVAPSSGGEDFKMTGTLNLSGGTLAVLHDFNPSGTVNISGGLLETDNN